MKIVNPIRMIGKWTIRTMKIKTNQIEKGTEMSVRTLADLKLGTRPRNVLIRMFGDLEQVEINMLTSLSRSELLKQRSMGQTSIQEIEERLGQYGLRLREAGKNSNA